MQRTEIVFEVDAHPRRVWRLLHPRPPADAGLPRVVDHPGGRITILAEGDEAQQGLVRTCEFPVPRYLLSGGRGQSWEVIVEARLFGEEVIAGEFDIQGLLAIVGILAYRRGQKKARAGGN